MSHQVLLENSESERLKEDFESLARSVKCCPAAHSFAAAEGVSVVWNSPLNCFRNSIASKAVLTHEPGSLPTCGARFLENVERLTCQELVLDKATNQAAFTQHWNFTRRGNYEHYIFTRVYSNSTRDTTEILVDTATQTSRASRQHYEF